jgi:hypothetical protein
MANHLTGCKIDSKLPLGTEHHPLDRHQMRKPVDDFFHHPAAMGSKPCRLTTLRQHDRRLVRDNRI